MRIFYFYKGLFNHFFCYINFQIIGMNRPCYVSEHSEVNPKNKTMTLKSRNVSNKYNKIKLLCKIFFYHPAKIYLTLIFQVKNRSEKSLLLNIPQRSPNHLNFCRSGGPTVSDFLSARHKSCRPEILCIKSRYFLSLTNVRF